MDVLVTSGHPIYNPEAVYMTMELNHTESWMKATKQLVLYQDDHFKSTADNYDKLVAVVEACIQLTQFYLVILS